jgi:heptosyltransferase-1
MPDILFIKTSSLGDVIHNMPAATEARAHRIGLRIGWVVERAFASLVVLHPAVDEVITVGTRDWRRTWYQPSAWSAMGAFRRALRARRYDAIIDTQGLLFKSALIARLAKGVRHGYDAGSIREPMASRLYDVRHAVARNQHAIARNRALTGLALGYTPQGEPDFGLHRARLAEPWERPYAVLLHGTAARRKEWPQPHWQALAAALSRDIDVVLPHGNDREQARSIDIAADNPRARVAERRPLDAMARLIAGASYVVGVDTGLLHLAAALGVPLVAIFVASEPRLTGPVGPGAIEIVGANAAAPAVADVLAAVARIRA